MEILGRVNNAIILVNRVMDLANLIVLVVLVKIIEI